MPSQRLYSKGGEVCIYNVGFEVGYSFYLEWAFEFVEVYLMYCVFECIAGGLLWVGWILMNGFEPFCWKYVQSGS